MAPILAVAFDSVVPRVRRVAGHLRGRGYATLSSNISPSLRVDRGVTIRALSKLKVSAGTWLKEGVLLDARTNQDFGVVVGCGVTIRAYAYLDAYGENGFISIGDGAGIGQYVYIGGNGGVVIGKYAMISGHTYIVSATHRFDSTSGEPYVKQGEVRIGVTIGDNAWVAANCVVMDGVTIGNGAVIGAGSVVTRSIPPLVLAAGCPARIIRSLSESELQPRR